METLRMAITRRIAADRAPAGAGPTAAAQLPSLPAFFLHFIRQRVPLLLTVFVLGGALAALDLVTPLAVGTLFKLLLSGSLRTADPSSSWPVLLGLAGLMIVVRPALQFAHNRLVNVGLHGGFTSLVRWQSNLQVLRRNLPFFQQDLSGRIASHVLRVGPAVTNALVQALAVGWQLMLFIGVSIALLAHAHWLLALPLLCWVVSTAAWLAHALPAVRRKASASNDRQSLLTARIVDVYSNMATVISFGRIGAELGELSRDHRAYDRALCDQMRAVTQQGLALSILNAGLVVGTAALGIHLLMAGAIDAGSLAIAIPLVWQASSISGLVANQLTSIVENNASVRDALQSVAPESGPAPAAALPALRSTRGEIRFEGVDFAYRAGLDVVRDLTLTIRPGERVGLIGTSGSGKTTLVSLLLSVLRPDGGRILIDDQDLSALDPDSVRDAIGLMPQEAVLFHRSIEENIAYGRVGATRTEVEAAARRAHADEFIRRHVDWCGRSGYDAHVGDRGAQLSGGQRQRIGIARVMLKDAPILVLDEATNALDAETESAVQRELGTLMEGRTVLAIAHRLSTIARMDRLVVIDAGTIAEEGTHAALLARGGLYASLWNRQRADFL